MKAKERHRLKEDLLTEWILNSVRFVRENAGYMAVLALLIGLGVLLYTLKQRQDLAGEMKAALALQNAVGTLREDPAKALETVTEAARETGGTPSDPWLLHMKGTALRRQAEKAEDPQEKRSLENEAIASYKELANTYPRHYAAPLALYAVGIIEENRQQGVAAKRVYERILTQFPNSPAAYLLWFRLRGEIPTPEEMTRTDEEGLTPLDKALALFELQMMRYREALGTLDQERETGPENPREEPPAEDTTPEEETVTEQEEQ